MTKQPAVAPLRWGVLGAARIATERVIPALQASPLCRVDAIASRHPQRAWSAAERLRIDNAFHGYQALLDTADVDAVYIPLPNHLHLEWSLKALRAGKHVLCEKPLTLNAAQARELIAERDRSGRCIEEAFVVYHHPQWRAARELISSGEIGELRSIQCAYSYPLRDRTDVRWQSDCGGGVIYDLGCYATTICRLLFDAEPERVLAAAELDAESGVEHTATALLQFAAGHASVSASFAAARQQCVRAVGTEGWLSADYPFAQAEPKACRLQIGDADSVGAMPAREIHFEPVNAYTLMGEHFAKLVRGEPVTPRPLESALGNMCVIDALYRSLRDGGNWQNVAAVAV